MGDNFEPIVIDNGSNMMKSGFGGLNMPSSVFPTIIGRYDVDIFVLFQKDFLVGHDASSKFYPLNMNYPIERGIITNWDDMERIWQHIFNKELNVNSKDHPVLMIESTFGNKKDRKLMAEIMFEKYNVPMFYGISSAETSLYAHNLTTGTVINCGDGITQSIAIEDGEPIPGSAFSINLAGGDLTDYMVRLLKLKGYNFITFSEREIVRKIKQRLCYITSNFIKSIQSPTDDIERYYELPDGQVIRIDFERFKCVEPLFKPSLLEFPNIGIHEVAYNTIMKCDESIRKTLFNNIVLSGGSTVFPGIIDRLQEEISALSGNVKRDIKIIPNSYGICNSWIGGSIISSLSTFKNVCVSKSKYYELGF